MRRYTIEVTEFQKAALAAVLAIYAHNSDVPQSFGGEDFRPPVLIGDLMELVAVARLEGEDNPGSVPVPVKPAAPLPEPEPEPAAPKSTFGHGEI